MEDLQRTEVPWLKGFYFVPEFPKYAINKDGELRNLATNRVISWSIAKGGGKKNIKGGYRVTNIYCDDGGRRGVSRHRLLALLFIPCPGDPANYNVNHSNGIPGDDRLDNLEWATPAENVKHAYENNLYSNKTKSVILRYWKTGEQLWFQSVAECARHLEKTESVLRHRIRKVPGKAHDDGLQIKLDDDTPWISPRELVIKTRKTSDFVAKDLSTGKIYLYESLRQLTKVHGFNYNVVLRRLCQGVTSPHKGYLIREWSENLDWSQ